MVYTLICILSHTVFVLLFLLLLQLLILLLQRDIPLKGFATRCKGLMLGALHTPFAPIAVVAFVG